MPRASPVPAFADAAAARPAVQAQQAQESVEKRYWLLWIGLVLSCEAWILAWYGESAASMAQIWWRSETFAHGMIVYPICIWLVWRERATLAHVRPRPSILALFAIAAAGFAWLVADAGQVQAGEHASLVIMIALVPCAILGLRFARAISFPLLFTLFAIPIGEFLLPVMMHHTADFTVAALRLSGIPVYREGLQFIIPSGRWSVVEACSGLRYLIASIVLGSLYAYLTYRSHLRRTVFILASIATPIIANWIRAYMIVMIGHLSDMKLAAGVDHLIYGWLFFGLVMLLLFWIGSFWREDRLESPPGQLRLNTSDGAGAPGMPALASVVVAAAVAASWPFYASTLDAEGAIPEISLAAPTVAMWRATDAEPTFLPRYSGSRERLFQAYARDAERVGLYIAYYMHQGEGTELINFKNTIVPWKDPEWQRIGEGKRDLPSRGPTVVQTEVKGNRDVLLVWHWYWIAGRWTSSNAEAKVLQAASRLLGRGDDAAMIAVVTSEEAGRAAAEQRLVKFVRAALDPLRSTLEDARASSRRQSASAIRAPSNP